MRGALLVLLTLSLIAATAAEDRPTSPKKITLDLCATDVVSHEWSANLWQTIQEVVQEGKYPKELKITFSSSGKPCQEQLFACQAEPNEILCSEQSINRLLLASTWLAAHDAQQIWLGRRMSPMQVLQEVGQMDFTAALQIADAINDDDSDEFHRLVQFHRLNGDLKDLVTEVQKTETDPHYHSKAGPAVWIAGRMHDIASSELIAVILGHEFSHAMGGCHLTAPSEVERSGQFRKLVDMQAKGAGFVRKLPSKDEILADECALRVLEQVDAAWVASDSTFSASNRPWAQSTTSGGRWIALDAYATSLANSLSRRSASGMEDNRPGLYIIGPAREAMAVESEGNEGYLFAASRLALVATTLHERQASEDPRHKVVLCGLAARQFLSMLKIAGDLQKDNKSPEFADLFGTIVAPGVAAGLRTGVWHNENPGSSYACEQ